MPNEKRIATGVPVASALGGLVLGAALALTIPILIRRYKRKPRTSFSMLTETESTSDRTSRPTRPPSQPSPDTIEPFRLDAHDSPRRTSLNSAGTTHQTQAQTAPSVYVVHHDGGAPPPVSVYVSNGANAEVHELPPLYENGPSSSPAARLTSTRQGSKAGRA